MRTINNQVWLLTTHNLRGIESRFSAFNKVMRWTNINISTAHEKSYYDENSVAAECRHCCKMELR